MCGWVHSDTATSRLYNMCGWVHSDTATSRLLVHPGYAYEETACATRARYTSLSLSLSLSLWRHESSARLAWRDTHCTCALRIACCRVAFASHRTLFRAIRHEARAASKAIACAHVRCAVCRQQPKRGAKQRPLISTPRCTRQ